MISRREFVLLAAAAPAAMLSPQLAAQGLQAGKEFQVLANPQPVETGKKIEVLEFFSYGCPHCADLEPYLAAWHKAMPADAQFRRVPVVFSARWEGLAKAFYALETMGIEDKLAPAIFDGLHKQKLPLHEDKALFDFVAKQGVDRAKFEEVYKSFAVGSKVSRSKAVAQAYGINSVPTVVVDGKFVVSSDRVGGHAKMPAAINALVGKARDERPKS